MGQIHMNEVRCTGKEDSIFDCQYKNITQEDCKHSEDASVKCNIPYMGYENTVSNAILSSIRLSQAPEIRNVKFWLLHGLWLWNIVGEAENREESVD